MSNKRFTVTEGHIKLLRESYIYEYDGNGNFFQDGKRPYGNSDILEDIHKILGTVPVLEKHGEPIFSEEQDAYALRIHRELATALMCILRSGHFGPGDFETSSPYSQDWRKL